jgi:hypothetical protein
MATPFYLTTTIAYEDAKGNLTGDSDQFTWYATDAAGFLQLNATGGKTFVFSRAPCRIVDIVSDAAATVLGLQLYVNNLPRNIKWRFASLLGANPNRVPSPIRIAAGSQIEFMQTTT